MSVTIKGKFIPKMIATPFVPAKPIKKKSTHVIEQCYLGSFTEPGKFRVANWMYYLDLSHSAVRERMRPYSRRRIPPPDGKDGSVGKKTKEWWHPATAFEYLKKYNLI